MIKLNKLLERSDAQKASLEKGYIYKDIKFDLEFSRYLRDELYASAEPKDLDESLDAKAIFNSIRNILTTVPGEKLLNPLFGLDFRQFLFEPINVNTAYFIAQAINLNLGTYDPRIDLNQVNITANADDNEYNIDIEFSVPVLEIYNLNLKANINKDGYVVV